MFVGLQSERGDEVSVGRAFGVARSWPPAGQLHNPRDGCTVYDTCIPIKIQKWTRRRPWTCTLCSRPLRAGSSTFPSIRQRNMWGTEKWRRWAGDEADKRQAVWACRPGAPAPTAPEAPAPCSATTPSSPPHLQEAFPFGAWPGLEAGDALPACLCLPASLPGPATSAAPSVPLPCSGRPVTDTQGPAGSRAPDWDDRPWWVAAAGQAPCAGWPAAPALPLHPTPAPSA